VYFKGLRAVAGDNIEALADFIEDVKNARTAHGLPPGLKAELLKMRGELMQAPNDETQDDRTRREEVIQMLDEALQPVGRAGMVCDHANSGAVVTQVFAGSEAARAGLAAGDRITAIDGRSISTIFTVPQAFARARGRRVRAEVVKRGMEVVTLELGLK
jgi:C-terminal processing protease CtpA/Prc